MSLDSPKGEVRYFEEFLGDTLETDMTAISVTSSGTVALTNVEIDGTVQLDTDTDTSDAAQIAGGLNYRVQDGALRLEARVKLDVITNVALVIGFNDQTGESDTVPTTNSSDVFTAVATDFIGFSFDTNATTDVWTCAWTVADAVTAEPIANRQFTGLAPVANKYDTFILELQDRGAGNTAYATFTIITNSGKVYTKEFETTIARDAVLTWYVGHENNTGTTHETTIDYIEVRKSRAVGID